MITTIKATCAKCGAEGNGLCVKGGVCTQETTHAYSIANDDNFRFAVLKGNKVVASGEVCTLDQVEMIAKTYATEPKLAQTSFAPIAWFADAPLAYDEKRHVYTTVAWPKGSIGFENCGKTLIGERL